jgi:CHAT domain-containing protein/tetratricopeptide (TPR) repeat protein
MRHLAVVVVLTLCAQAVVPFAARGGWRVVALRRELSKEDARRARDLDAKAKALGRQGKFAEARGPISQILELYTRVLGKDHFDTDAARRELATLDKLAGLPDADRAEYRETYVLSDEIASLLKKTRFTDALQRAERILDIRRRLLGPDSSLVAVSAHQVGELLHYCERYRDAEAQFRESRRILRALVGDTHPAVAAVSGDLAQTLEMQGKYSEARQLHEESLALTARLRGENHPDTAVSANNLASFLDRQARYAEAERLYRRAVAALEAAEGRESSKLATSYGNLALNLNHQGRYQEAGHLFEEALRIRRKLSGDEHPDTGRVYMNLGTNREAMGDIAGAETLLRKALDNYRKGYGDKSSQTAWAMSNLALNLDNQGRYAEAEPLLRNALAIVEQSPEHLTLYAAKLSNNLAACLQSQERYSEAGELCSKALATLRQELGPDQPEVAAALNNVAFNLHIQGKYAEAEQHFREALAITEKRQGAGHADAAVARINLAVNLHYQGQFDEADRLIRESLAAQRRVVGDGHAGTSWGYKNLAMNYCAQGAYDRVEAMADAAAASFETARLRIGFSGLDRARRTEDISPLPALSVAAARLGKSEAAWRHLEQNLARGLLDDLTARPLKAEDKARETELLGRLEALDRRVASGTGGAGADGDAKDPRLQRDAAQVEFAHFQADVAKRYGVTAGAVYELRRIQAQLPVDAALIGWLDLPDRGAGARQADPRGDHWGYLVRQRGEPVWVQLHGSGPDGAWTDEDDRLRMRVRRAFAERPADAAGAWEGLARRLLQQRLAPLEDHLSAKGDLPAVRQLIVLPSPKMAGVPLEALTDRFTVSYAPSGTMFAWLAERRPGRRATAANLLALGDPEFASSHSIGTPSGPRGQAGASRSETFARLPGTRQELLGVARVFSESRILLGSQASEKQLDGLVASDSLRSFRYLHFATHGVLDDRQPLRSSIILARDPESRTEGVPPADGRLTAERILRQWKLDADLVTLSACETGVGKFSGGEGYVGFSQALFVAGAHSLVLSLWQVEDAATALLMTRFYENLLGTPEGTIKPMEKAVALAEAKKWLRGLSADELKDLTKDLPKRGTRGRIEPRQGAENVKALRAYDHPYYWSGFILAGDPR